MLENKLHTRRQDATKSYPGNEDTTSLSFKVCCRKVMWIVKPFHCACLPPTQRLSNQMTEEHSFSAASQQQAEVPNTESRS